MSRSKQESTGGISWYHSNFQSGGGLVAKSCWTLVTPCTVACQVPLSMGFSRQEYWSGLPFSSVQFSGSVVSNCLWPHGLQHARPLCPSPTPRVYPNSYPLSWWCHPTISSSVIPFFCSQSFPASGSFQMSQLFASGGQSIGISASTSVLPMNTQDWSSLGWTGWISLQSKGLSRVFSNTTFAMGCHYCTVKLEIFSLFFVWFLFII